MVLAKRFLVQIRKNTGGRFAPPPSNRVKLVKLWSFPDKQHSGAAKISAGLIVINRLFELLDCATPALLITLILNEQWSWARPYVMLSTQVTVSDLGPFNRANWKAWLQGETISYTLNAYMTETTEMTDIHRTYKYIHKLNTNRTET